MNLDVYAKLSKGGSNSAVGMSSSEQQKLEGQFQKVLQRHLELICIWNPTVSETEENWGNTSGTYPLCPWGGWVLILTPLSGQHQANFSTSNSGGLICMVPNSSEVGGARVAMSRRFELLTVRCQHGKRTWCPCCSLWKTQGARIRMCTCRAWRLGVLIHQWIECLVCAKLFTER